MGNERDVDQAATRPVDQKVDFLNAVQVHVAGVGDDDLKIYGGRVR